MRKSFINLYILLGIILSGCISPLPRQERTPDSATDFGLHRTATVLPSPIISIVETHTPILVPDTDTSQPTITLPSVQTTAAIVTLPSTTTPDLSLTPTEKPVSRDALYFYNEEETAYRYVYPIFLGQNSVRLGPDYVRFAHFADRLVHKSGREAPYQLLLANLALEDERVIRDDVASYYAYWSPDDWHLIFVPDGNPASGSIYHIKTNTWEAWPYNDCNQVAVSPKTGRLATWCLSVSNPDTFAVIEWGGEIWVS